MKRKTAILLTSAWIVAIVGCDTLLEELEDEESGTQAVSGPIDSDTVWSSDTDYRVTDDVDVRATLEIEPGTRVHFEQGNRMAIRGSGALIAEGTGDDPIRFTGTEETPGWWDGIWFRESEDPRNRIDHAIVEYAGGDFYAVQLGEFRITGSSVDAAAAITNSTIRHSDRHGVYVQRGSRLIDFDNNRITSNGAFPVTLRGNPPAAAAIGTTSDLTGNDSDAVRIYEDNNTISSDLTYADPGVPYRVEDADIDVSGAVLTVTAGVTMEFDSGSSIRVTSGGGLQVEGTPDDQVRFTAVQQVPGFWTGITYVDSSRPDNKIEHAVIEYGGSEPNFSGWNSSSGGNVTLGRSISSADLSIANSTIRHSSSYGIYVYDGNLDQDSVEFEGNNEGDVEVRS